VHKHFCVACINRLLWACQPESQQVDELTTCPVAVRTAECVAI
jgi:hypothetical protein